MRDITRVAIRCGHCGASFAPPLRITTLEVLEGFAAWGGIVDCVQCHHFVEIGKHSLSYQEVPVNPHAAPGRLTLREST